MFWTESEIACLSDGDSIDERGSDMEFVRIVELVCISIITQHS